MIFELVKITQKAEEQSPLPFIGDPIGAKSNS